MIKIDIYRSFEQWKNGNVLEHGVPRTEYYSEKELSLVEMGWNYGYDAGLAEQPAPVQPCPHNHTIGDGSPENTFCYDCKTFINRTALAEQPAHQEPVAWNVIDPLGKVVATETNAVRGWARIDGYKPTVEGLLGFHEKGWRVVPTAPQPPAQPLTPEWIWTWLMDWCKRNGSSPANYNSLFKMVADARAIEAAHGITKGDT